MQSRLKSAAEWIALRILVERSQCFKRDGNRIGKVLMVLKVLMSYRVR